MPQRRRIVAIDLLGQSQAVGLQLLAPFVDQGKHPLVDVRQAARHARGNFHAKHSQVVIVAQLLFEFVELLGESHQVRRTDSLQQLHLVIEVFGLLAALVQSL